MGMVSSYGFCLSGFLEGGGGVLSGFLEGRGGVKWLYDLLSSGCLWLWSIGAGEGELPVTLAIDDGSSATYLLGGSSI